MLAPIAGFVYLIFNPRLTWLMGSVSFVSHILKKIITQPGIAIKAHAATFETPFWNDAEEYWHMFWNNAVLLSAWVLMSSYIGPALFFTVHLVSVSLAGGAGIVIFTVQHNFEHSYATGSEDWDFDAAAIRGTSFLILPRWLGWFIANAAYHHVHHLSAKIPNYRLVECHDDHRDLFSEVTRIKLSHIPRAMKYILWDTRSRRITSVAEYRRQSG